MNEQFWWYMTRASGLVAWIMLTASVIWGIILSTKAFPNQRRPKWLLAVHRWLGGLTLGFLAIHITSLILDNYVHFDLLDVLVPFATNWKPGAVALGILSMWLLVAIELTSLAKRHLSRRVWRGVHLSSYAVFWLTSLHAAYAGTDSSTTMYKLGAGASVVAIAWSLMYRISHRRGLRRAARSAGGTRPAARRDSTKAIS